MKNAFRRWHGPPLAVQILLLLLGVLVVAQLVTLALTLLLPPAPQPQYQLDDIARLLAGVSVAKEQDQRPLQRLVQLQPPDPAGPGWLTSDASRGDLARLLGVPDNRVRLYFYTPLPFAGATSPLPPQRVFRDTAAAPQRPVVLAPGAGQVGAGPVGVPDRLAARVSQPVGGQGAGPAAGAGRPGMPAGNALPDMGAFGATGAIGGLIQRPPVRPPQQQQQQQPSSSHQQLALPTMTLPPVVTGVPGSAPFPVQPSATPAAANTAGKPAAPVIPLLLPPAAALTPIRPPAGAERWAGMAGTAVEAPTAGVAKTDTVGPQAAALDALDHRLARGETRPDTRPETRPEARAEDGSRSAFAAAAQLQPQPLIQTQTLIQAQTQTQTQTQTQSQSQTQTQTLATAQLQRQGVPLVQPRELAAAAPAIAAVSPSALATALARPALPVPSVQMASVLLAGGDAPRRPPASVAPGTPPDTALQTAPQPALRTPDAQPQQAEPAIDMAAAPVQQAVQVQASTAATIPARMPPEPSGMDTVRGLLGLAPAPFVVGDFIAGVQLASGGWAVVQPTPEPFPNAWQRRVLLWFAVALLLVAPLAWFFSRRLVLPITGFARAAEQLGRDPTATLPPLDGPAEVGRAAHAFNTMQSRLRSFIDDRTTMIGAISHDLRTPLTRMRFRIDDAPDGLRDGLLRDVQDMEAMIDSVLAFLRDASDPGARAVQDLRAIAEHVVADTVFVGRQVVLEPGAGARVEVDAMAMRRLLGNLIDNAVKYGDRAEVRLFTDHQFAIVEVSDHGKGLPDDELERVFQPFYRAPDALASAQSGSGLGLAVCRSIARAHGGDVNVKVGNHGLVAQVRLPLSALSLAPLPSARQEKSAALSYGSGQLRLSPRRQ